MEKAAQFAGILLKGAASPEALVAKYAEKFLDGAIKLNEFIDEARNAWADSKEIGNYSWDAVRSAVECALDFINVVKQFASWGHSADRIERVKSALKAGDFKAIDSFMDTLDTHVEQTNERYKLFQKNADKAIEETYNAAKDVEKKATKAKSRKRIVRGVGGTASSLLLAGGITGTVLTVLFPPAGIPLLVVAAVGTGIAATGGVATAVGTGIAAANIKKTAKQMTELARMLNDLSTSAGCLLENVQEAKTWLHQCLNTMAVTRTAYEHAKKGYTPDTIDAVERFRMESQTLHSAASVAGDVLTKLKQDLKSHMHCSPRASSDKK
ncbi:uncharacterized protein LOC134185709 [Corticium candelabrum]|uniref:uncharacterized protein LOC134185709 n=1 Tax=Corticium candelabrum TaxID=121492 RepID=UPI002E262D86|nr:uncharacterized protein LOC134185709 [Corticium candelabrum]